MSAGNRAADIAIAALEADIHDRDREAEERRLERDVVEAAVAWDTITGKPQDFDRDYRLRDDLADACARLSAFRKEKGTRT